MKTQTFQSNDRTTLDIFLIPKKAVNQAAGGWFGLFSCIYILHRLPVASVPGALRVCCCKGTGREPLHHCSHRWDGDDDASGEGPASAAIQGAAAVGDPPPADAAGAGVRGAAAHRPQRHRDRPRGDLPQDVRRDRELRPATGSQAIAAPQPNKILTPTSESTPIGRCMKY